MFPNCCLDAWSEHVRCQATGVPELMTMKRETWLPKVANEATGIELGAAPKLKRLLPYGLPGFIEYDGFQQGAWD